VRLAESLVLKVHTCERMDLWRFPRQSLRLPAAYATATQLLTAAERFRRSGVGRAGPNFARWIRRIKHLLKTPHRRHQNLLDPTGCALFGFEYVGWAR